MIEYQNFEYTSAKIEATALTTSQGQKEYHLIIHPRKAVGFKEQYNLAKDAMRTFIRNEAPEAVPIFMRWFMSDAANQQEIIEADDFPCAVSYIEQPPLDGSKVKLWVWLASDASVSRSDDGLWTAEFSGSRHLWLSHQIRTKGNSLQQTWDMFNKYSDLLKGRGCSLKDNCIRTWLYVQDIDANYEGVVKGRRELFSQEGLTPQTHYIASTGIAGRAADLASKIIMDAYALEDIHESQVHYLKGSTHLNPTHEYGVTFERGTLVEHQDRSHVFISGTASINNKGEIEHPGDITGQTSRMIRNVEVLLEEAGCTYKDVMVMTVYLRDIADYDDVHDMIMERFPDHPKAFLWAPVCRPGWLVEMECIASR